MTPDLYTKTLEWALARGLQLHDGIERRQENGVWGMYASKPIKKGKVIASYPKERALKPLDQFSYPESMSPMERYCHSASYEFQKNDLSEFSGIFNGLESLEYLRESSVYYASSSEKDLLGKLSPLLLARVGEFETFVISQREKVCGFDKSIPFDLAEMIILNTQSRSWSDSGFLPIMDLFNHSDKKGVVRGEDNDTYLIRAGVNYQPGDQVYLSYSQKDMYLHAIHYNYFDPNGQHFIHFGYRFVQPALTPFARSVMEFTRKRHLIKTLEQGGKMYYRSLDPRAVFNETEPSKELLAYLKDNSLQTDDELSAGRASRKSQRSHILSALNALLEQNRVDQVPLHALPEKLHRFWHLLKKEKKMLQANLNWVEKNV